MTPDSRHDLEHHLQAFWPESRIESFHWTLGPIEKSLPGFTVLRVSPQIDGDLWTYVSNGAASVCSHPDRHEFCMAVHSESPRHVELLAMVAFFHADPKYRLGLGKVLEIGRPWVEGSKLDHLLVSLPYPYGPKFEHCKVSGTDVRILWLLPIAKAEADYVRSHGAEALEQEFDRTGIHYWDPHRASVVRADGPEDQKS